MPEPEVFPDALVEALADATGRLVRSVDALPEGAWREPSLLPGWSRAHVVAHLVLNAEALSGVLRGVVGGERTAMYPSQLHRDAAIADLAEEASATLRERLLASSTVLADAMAAVPTERWDHTFRRIPGGPERSVSTLPDMRLREVEVHHVDLALAATPGDWPVSFSARLVEAMLARRPVDRPLRVHATDLDRTWESPGPAATTVRGRAADLGWWLTGRGTGEGLTTDDGELPGIEEL